MKTILVPADFSTNSKNAIDYAVLLAKKLNMKLLLLHAFHSSMAEVIRDSYKILSNKDVDHTPKEMEKELKLWCEALKSAEKNLECNSIFTQKNLIDEVHELEEENSFDLIVMGTKGASGIKEILIGSNAAKIIEQVSCPVIAIPIDYQLDELKTIVFATDYHKNDIGSVQFLVQLAKKFDAEIKIVHVEDKLIEPRLEENLMEFFIQKIEKVITYNRLKYHLLNAHDIKKTLNEFITDHKADLFAISTKDRILIGPLFNKGLTKNFAHHIQIPFLAFHSFNMNESDL